MQGEMDPFFFLTKHKNFIPHEYPCRTDFAAALSRQTAGAAAASSPRAAGCPSARRGSTCPASGSARPRLAPGRAPDRGRRGRNRRASRSATCGGAVLWLNGGEAGWMATLQPQFRGKARDRAAAAGGPERGHDLLRRSRRARCALFPPARLSCGPACARRHAGAGRGGGRGRGRGGARGHALRAHGLSPTATSPSSSASPPVDVRCQCRGRRRLHVDARTFRLRLYAEAGERASPLARRDGLPGRFPPLPT